MSSPVQPLIDHAAGALQDAQGIDDTQRADLYDAFQSKNPDELKQHLQTLAIPDDVKNSLHQAKLTSVMPSAPAGPQIGQAEKGISVISRMAAMNPKELDLAEAHPNILKALIGAATTPEKAPETPGAAAGASKPAGKGKPSSGASSAAGEASLAADYPPVPSGHALVQTSDRGLHHVPVANVEGARKIDPDLKVLHVEP